MKHIFLLLLIALSVSTIMLQGCVEQTDEVLVTASINLLGFRSDELPDGVTKLIEDFDDTETPLYFPNNVTVTIRERYIVSYGFNETQQVLFLEMQKCNSTEEARSLFGQNKDDFFTSSGYQIISAEEIADESVMGKLASHYNIIFRKFNIVSTLDAEVSQQAAIDYAKIIINHIESSL
ncbi:MAG: hypothetical protein JSW60_03105 [Thermoplasmatales archaeon]|nr:MAG: hypothetical protein JSW60_03105 [Thermoplasmatales archaeon]